MKRRIFLPLVAVFGGLAGYALHWRQMTTGFDRASGLVLDNPVGPVLLWLTAAVAILSLVLSIGRHRTFSDYSQAFACGRLYQVVSSLAAIPMGIAGVLALRAGVVPSAIAGHQLLQLLLGLCAIGSFMAMLLIPCSLSAGKGEQLALTMLPVLTGCVWLLSIYRVEAINPILSSYGYEILAAAVATLAVYFPTSYSFGVKWRPVLFCVVSAVGIYLCLTGLGSGRGVSDCLLFLAFALYQLGNLLVFLHNDHEEQRIGASDHSNHTEAIPHE